MATFDVDWATDRVYFELQQKDSASNSRLTAALVLEELQLAHQQVARDARCYKRSTTVTAVTDQVLYTFPTGMFELNSVRWDDDTTPLLGITLEYLNELNPGWRTDDSGTPVVWYPWDARQFGVWRAPTTVTTEVFTVDGYIVPLDYGVGTAPTGWIELPTSGSDTFNLPDILAMLPIWWAVASLAAGPFADRDTADKVVAKALTNYKRGITEYVFAQVI